MQACFGKLSTKYKVKKVGPEEALKKWRDGAKLDSGNQIIKKQIWAVENPSKFYSGAVDYDWQSKQD